MFSASKSPIWSSQVPASVPTPLLSRSLPSKSGGTPLFAGSLFLAISLALSASLCPCGRMHVCLSDYPSACLIPVCVSLPSLPSQFRLPPAALVQGPRQAGSGRLGSGCSNSGETASGSAPSAEPHSSRAGPLLFAAFPAPPRPPGGREGGREGVIEKASERASKEQGALALIARSLRTALLWLTELRPLPEPGASPPGSSAPPPPP